MEHKIILILKVGGCIYYAGTFYDCTYTIKDSFDDIKALNIFNKGNRIYSNNAKIIEFKEVINDITEEKEIEIVIDRDIR